MQTQTGAQPREFSTQNDVATLFDLFVRDRLYLKGWSQKTVRSYRQAFSNFHAHMVPGPDTTPGLEAVHKASLQAWVLSMRERGMAPGGANVYIRGINSFLSWLHSGEHMPTRLRIPLQRKEERTLETFSDREIQIIVSFHQTRFTEWRIWTLMFLLFDTGCRIEEVLTIKESDADLDNLLLTVHRKWKKEGKGAFQPRVSRPSRVVCQPAAARNHCSASQGCRVLAGFR